MISLIVARAKNGAIGKDNNLLWHLPADMKFFKETTSGHCIITGRKNYESIPPRFRPLANRTNIVVTRNKDYAEEGALVLHSLEEAINAAQNVDPKKIFIIGGGQIYSESLRKGLVDEMIITEVDAELEADTFFPSFDTSQWSKEVIRTLPKDEKNKFSATIVKYTKSV